MSHDIKKDDIKKWLTDNGFQECYDLLQQEGITSLSLLKILTEGDLKELASQWNFNMLRRRLFLNKVAMLTDQSESPPPEYSVNNQVNNQANNQTNVVCPLHGKPVELLCIEDNVLVCIICLSTTHHGHKGERIFKIYEKEKTNIRTSITTAKQKIDHVRRVHEQAKALHLEIKQKKSSFDEEVNAYFNVCATALENRKKKILSNGEEILQEKENILSNQIVQLTSSLEILTKTIAGIEDSLAKQSPSNVLSSLANLHRQLSEMEHHKVNLIISTTSNLDFIKDETFLSCISSHGAVYGENFSPQHTIARGEGLELVSPGEKASFVIIVKKNNGTRKCEGGDKFTISTQGHGKEQVIMDVKDNQNGTYTVTYDVPGETDKPFQIDIKHCGQDILGSPFKPRFSFKWNREKCGCYLKISDNGASVVRQRGNGHQNATVYGKIGWTSGIHKWALKCIGNRRPGYIQWMSFGVATETATLSNYGGNCVYATSTNAVVYGELGVVSGKGSLIDGGEVMMCLDCDKHTLEFTYKNNMHLKLKVPPVKLFPFVHLWCIGNKAVIVNKP